jgi:hypothetical protein
MHQIKVVHTNKKPICDFFDGIAYNFVPEVPQNISLEVAAHIFGVEFPADKHECESQELRDKIYKHLARRWGWNTRGKEKAELGDVMFSKFKFIPVQMKMVEMVIQNEDLPLPRGDKTDVVEDAEEA